MNLTHQSILQLEVREANGTISLNKLQTVAEAMHCTFVYGFVPNRPLSEMANDLDDRQEDAKRRHRAMPRPK